MPDMHIVLRAAVLLACVFCCAPWSARDAAALRVLTEESPPSSYRDSEGRPAGLSVEIVREIMRRTGTQAEIEVLPWARAYREACEVPGVALFATTRTPERERVFDWVGPILRASWVLYARRGSGLRLNDIEAAKELRVGAVIGDAREEFLRAQGFASVERVSSTELSLRMLLAGRIDAVISTNLGMSALLRGGEFSARDFEPVLTLRTAELFVAFSPRSDPETVRAWRAALDGMREDGSLDAIHAAWMPGEPPAR